jgi:glyoxylase-like metal-dependent hydrolase (beta-lactamase superfamily II)
VIPIVRVLAPNPSVRTLEGTNTWIVGRDPAIVIDPGPDLPEHLDEVARAAGRITHVLVTHDHPDHAPGAPELARRAGARLGAARLAGAERLRHGEVVEAGAIRVRVVATPGHTPDHLAFFVPTEGALFTGDAVLGRGTSVIDPPEGDLLRYLSSLRALVELEPRTIYPGHGPVVLDARARLEDYLRHRQEREEQILAALGDVGSTIDAIVERIYEGYPPEARELARRTVLAHLLKLEAEGRVERRGRSSSPTWSRATPRSCERCGRPVRGRSRYCPSCSLTVLQE